jgi:NADPH-dependent curcumin reductase CurA
MPGFTAYMGLLDIGQPKAGETLVVAAATGPVGATVGQIGKIKGCRVIGVAGGAEKCRYATEILGFDLCLDHYADDFAAQLAKACPNGIDVYYENVGGKVFDAVLPLLNTSARVPVCGLVSGYNATGLPDGPDRLSLLMATILKNVSGCRVLSSGKITVIASRSSRRKWDVGCRKVKSTIVNRLLMGWKMRPRR